MGFVNQFFLNLIVSSFTKYNYFFIIHPFDNNTHHFSLTWKLNFFNLLIFLNYSLYWDNNLFLPIINKFSIIFFFYPLKKNKLILTLTLKLFTYSECRITNENTTEKISLRIFNYVLWLSWRWYCIYQFILLSFNITHFLKN